VSASTISRRTETTVVDHSPRHDRPKDAPPAPRWVRSARACGADRLISRAAA
jgi:hypothetical protein